MCKCVVCVCVCVNGTDVLCEADHENDGKGTLIKYDLGKIWAQRWRQARPSRDAQLSQQQHLQRQRLQSLQQEQQQQEQLQNEEQMKLPSLISSSSSSSVLLSGSPSKNGNTKKAGAWAGDVHPLSLDSHPLSGGGGGAGEDERFSASSGSDGGDLLGSIHTPRVM